MGAAAVVSGCGGCGAEAFATIAERAGDRVEFKRGDAGFANAAQGQALDRGDMVRTGEESRTTVSFAAGGVVHLGANSELIVGLSGVDETAVTIKLGAGEMEVEAIGAGFRLLVGDDKDPVFLKHGRVMISLTGRGLILAVMDGEGTVERAGRSITVLSGQGLNLTEGGGPINLRGAGLNVTVGGEAVGVGVSADAAASPEAALAAIVRPDGGPDAPLETGVDGSAASSDSVVADGLDASDGPQAADASSVGDIDASGREVASDVLGASDAATRGEGVPSRPTADPSMGGAVLVDPERSVRLKAPGARRYARPSQARTPLIAGTGLKAKKGATIEGPGGARVRLGKRSSGQWMGGAGGAGHLSLARGEARVVVRKGEGSARLTTKGLRVAVSARGFTGNTSVKRSRKKTQIAVRVGFADVTTKGATVRVNGGQVMTVFDNGTVEGPRSVGSARLGAREGKRTRIYYDKRPRRIAFRWAGAGGAEATLEVARDEAFTKVVMREPLEQNSFTLASPQGTYYWRVIRDGVKGAIGVVRLRGDPSLGRSNASVKNRVRDTGKETRIYFQGPHPRLTFSWRESDGAATYQMRLYRSANLSSALVQKTTKKNYVTLPPNKLKEGTYFWYQSAHAEDGAELSTGQMNKLSLTFDNKLPTLRIDSVRGGKVSGVAARRTGLTLNGKAVAVDSSGRFTMRTSGKGPLIFRIKRGGGDTLFVRHR